MHIIITGLRGIVVPNVITGRGPQSASRLNNRVRAFEIRTAERSRVFSAEETTKL